MLQHLFVFTLFVIAYALREIPDLTIDDTKLPKDEEQYQFKVVIPPVQTQEVNRYICYSKSLSELGDSYVTKLLTEPNKKVAPHHVDSGLCLDPTHKDSAWDCNRGTACKDPTSPANVTITFKKEPTKYNYQKFLLSNSGVIPANQNSGFFTHVGCEWKRPKMFAFDYYVHTHNHGVFGEGFLIRNNSLTYLGVQMTRGRPKVQFDIGNGPVEILPGDILASTCLFINKENKTIELGSEDTCIF